MNNPLATDLDHVLEHTNDLWEELRGQRIFVTGGTGFFGCWLLESFIWANDQLQLGAQVVVLSRNPEAFVDKAPRLANHPAVSLLFGDVRTFEFPKGEFRYVIHAGSDASAKINLENPILMFESIVNGTQRILEFARNHGAVKFLLASSGAVYGQQPSKITHVPEDYLGAPDPMDPTAAYGEGKRAAEVLCRIYAQQFGLETKIARCFAFVGPYLPINAHYAIGNFIRDALKGGPIYVNGDGTPLRSYLYAADLTIWLWTILFKGQACHPYNVGSPHSINIADLATLVCRLIEPGLEIIISRQPDLSQPPMRYIPSVERAHNELMLESWIPQEEAIEKTVRWHKG